MTKIEILTHPKRHRRKHRNSQRNPDGSFVGGLQFGSRTNRDIRQRKSDAFTKLAAQSLAEDPEIVAAGWTYTDRMTTEETHGPRAFPDGGVWRRNGQIQGMSEAKNQGPTGNATQERWFKNHELFRFNGGVRSLTFLSGEGVRPTSTMAKEFYAVLSRERKPKEFNILYPVGNSFFSKENGFLLNEIMEIMKKWLLQPLSG